MVEKARNHQIRAARRTRAGVLASGESSAITASGDADL